MARPATLDTDAGQEGGRARPAARSWAAQRARGLAETGCPAEVVLDVEEAGSGARNDRPGLQRLMAAARRRKLDAVLVWKLDRFGRSALDLLASIRDLAPGGVRFIAVTQGIDVRPGGDAMSRLLVTMLAAVAEFERDLIRERTRLGMAKAKAAGKRVGRPGGPRPAHADVARLRAAGRSWREIAAALGCTT
jgi:DNA invertase Pin-like site-specific DNA recombinase